MTRPLQKRRERFFAEEAARSMGKTWSFGPDRERPDLLVTEGQYQFGLELCEIFVGPQNQSGSAMKRAESNTHSSLEVLRREYETITKNSLRAQFVGNMSDGNLASIVPALIAEDFPSKPVGHHVIVDQGRGLRVHVTKAFRSDWFSVNHRVGWVDRYPEQRIVEAIERKSRELPRYQEAAGPDIRLLIVADRIHNSGKFMLADRPTLDLHGFQAVYFFPYPEPAAAVEWGVF